MTFHANIGQDKPSLIRNFARNISPEFRSPPRLSRVRFLVRPWPNRVAPAGESFDAHIVPIPCSRGHLGLSNVHPYPHGPPAKCRNTPSTNELHVFAFQVGRLVWLNKDYCCLNTSYSSCKILRQGGNAWSLFHFENQSAAIFAWMP